MEAAVRQGLAEVADREIRAELSAYDGKPVLWAARLSAHGHDALESGAASPTPAAHPGFPAAGEQAIGLRPAQMDALRVYLSLGTRLRLPPADGLIERVRTAYFDRPGNRWRLCLNTDQIESVAYGFYLRSLTGSDLEANTFRRDHGIVYRVDASSGKPSPAVQPAGPVADRPQ
ncbi:DUF6417 family protein [Streptomyces avermitilis]|uniref:DUF6417 family protein n=1 Tax=Streptomyces avermitilis TaxID=33903 RepID=UPI0033A181B2